MLVLPWLMKMVDLSVHVPSLAHKPAYSKTGPSILAGLEGKMSSPFFSEAAVFL